MVTIQISPIAKYLQLIINSKFVPTNFNVGKIVPIIKDVRGDLSSLDNVRPITLSDTLATIFELYFLEKLNQKIGTNQPCGTH